MWCDYGAIVDHCAIISAPVEVDWTTALQGVWNHVGHRNAGIPVRPLSREKFPLLLRAKYDVKVVLRLKRQQNRCKWTKIRRWHSGIFQRFILRRSQLIIDKWRCEEGKRAWRLQSTVCKRGKCDGVWGGGGRRVEGWKADRREQRTAVSPHTGRRRHGRSWSVSWQTKYSRYAPALHAGISSMKSLYCETTYN